jgi:hypothetical protein
MVITKDEKNVDIEIEDTKIQQSNKSMNSSIWESQ